MTIYSKLLYLSLFFLAITSGIFESLSFFIFESIITILFFTIILKEQKLTITKVSSFVIYIFLILIVVGLIQGINYHSLAQAKIYLPFSLCPFLTLQDVNFLFAYLMLFLIIIQLFKTDEQTDKFLHTLLILFGIIVLILNFFPKDEFCTFFLCKREESKYIGPFFNRNSAGAFCSFSSVMHRYVLFRLPHTVLFQQIRLRYNTRPYHGRQRNIPAFPQYFFLS